MTTIIRLKRASAARWVTVNPILAEGEAGSEGDTGQMKVGDGVTRWNNLPYIGSGSLALDVHVNDETPHPVYDDGPSLVLLYENAKV